MNTKRNKKKRTSPKKISTVNALKINKFIYLPKKNTQNPWRIFYIITETNSLSASGKSSKGALFDSANIQIKNITNTLEQKIQIKPRLKTNHTY